MKQITKDTVVAVVLGGPSAEAEISRVTGSAIANALQEKGYNAKILELNPLTVINDLKAMGAEVVFNAVHGMYGEDGRLQSLLEAADIPYTGSRVMASAVAMDKCATKRFLVAAGISTPASMILLRRETRNLEQTATQIMARFGLPVVIKAASQGSSIGVTIAKEEKAILPALKSAFELSENVLVEECIKGKELTVSMMEEGDQIIPLPIIWIAPHSGVYDFETKYTKGMADHYCPAPFDAKTTEYVQSLGVETYKALGLCGVARVDVMLADNGIGYVLEANTVPGMTATSLVPEAAAAVGISFQELCEKILLSAR